MCAHHVAIQPVRGLVLPIAPGPADRNDQSPIESAACTIVGMGELRYNRFTLHIEGDELVVTYSRADGDLAVRVPVAQLERWVMKILRAEVFVA